MQTKSSLQRCQELEAEPLPFFVNRLNPNCFLIGLDVSPKSNCNVMWYKSSFNPYFHFIFKSRNFSFSKLIDLTRLFLYIYKGEGGIHKLRQQDFANF